MPFLIFIFIFFFIRTIFLMYISEQKIHMKAKQNGPKAIILIVCVGALFFLLVNLQPGTRPTIDIDAVKSVLIGDESVKSLLPDAKEKAHTAFNPPYRLTRHNLSVCMFHSDHGPYPPPYPLLEQDEAMQRRIQCYCLESTKPRDNVNCVVRIRNALVKRDKGVSIDVLLENTTYDFSAQVQNAGSPFSYLGVHIKAIKGVHERVARPPPYEVPILRTERPVFMAPSIIWVNGHYHAIIGPTGTLQAITTRDAINAFYAENEATEKVRPTSDVEIEHRYNENSSGVMLASAGSCSLMDFTASDRLVVGEDSLRDTPPGPVPPTYLSREMMFIDDLGDRNLPRVGTFDWFARRLGFCFSEVPEESYTVVSDLWVNFVTNQVGTQYRLRRNDSHIHPTPDHMVGRDYLNHCKLQEEEKKAARWSSHRIQGLFKDISPKLSLPSSSNTDEFVRQCTPLRRSRIVEGALTIPSLSGNPLAPQKVVDKPVDPNSDELCVMVVGRKVNDDPGTFRVRGVPPNIEISILEALLLPFEATKASDNEWKAKLHGINKNSGAEACGPETQVPYQFVSYPRTSNVFPNLVVNRSEIEHFSMPHQYSQIRSANLFIIEEGAPLVWSLVASYGSTFIVVYYSHHSRKEHNWGFQPHTDYFAHIPELTGTSRFIFFVIQRGTIPSFASLREAYDRPWKPETLIVMCEGISSHVTSRDDFNSGC